MIERFTRGKWGAGIKPPTSESCGVFEVEVAIRTKLERPGWSQAQLAKLLGIPRSNLNRSLNNLETVSFIRIMKICHILDIDLSPLL